ncbi:hypothetical protein [Corynebacterium sp. HMSC059E07]|uniref:hypothetical protein n=1 Tax=Corynebacterium sp. HMSC059E07 TaxID=1739471 RepID=UPI0008A13863|nr:hypothetical protein [Corynebacterium sp. HMSC059E07]
MKISKTLATKTCALVSATALATAAVVALPTNESKAALTDPSLTTRHGDDLGKGPQASITLNTDKEKVHPGDDVTATVELEGKVPFPAIGQWKYGESDATAVIFELQVDRKLKVRDADQLSFNWADGQTRTPKFVNVNEEDNLISFEFTPEELRLGPNPSMTVEIPVTVNEEANAGDELGIAVGTEVDIRPTLDWTWNDWKMSDAPNGDQCLRVATGDLKFENPGQYGTWLADLWLGTDTEKFELEEPASFTVTDKSGGEFTDNVFQGPSYPVSTLNPQESPTIWTGADGTDLQDYRWLQRFQWKINEKEFAGDVWIPEGSTIHIEQLVRSKDCTFDLATEHFGAKVESRNSPLFAQDRAAAALTVEEEPKPEEPSSEPSDSEEPSPEPSDSEEPTPTTEDSPFEPAPKPSKTPEECVPSTTTTTVTPSETEPEGTESTVTTSVTESEDTATPTTTTPSEDDPCPPVTVTSTATTTEVNETPAESTTAEPSSPEDTTTPETSTPAPEPSEPEKPEGDKPKEGSSAWGLLLPLVPLAIVPLLMKHHQPDTTPKEAPKEQPKQEQPKQEQPKQEQPAREVTEQPSDVSASTPERSNSVENQDSPSSRVLADTGANVKTIAGLALALLVAAIMLLWFARRKES